MSLSALAKRLADAGTPIEAIIMALEAVEAEQARAAEGRAKAAERKRRQRAKDRDEDVTVTGQSQDSPDQAPFPAPPNENNLTPPTHTPVNISTRAKADPFPCPVGVDETDWSALKANRKAKKAALTEGAHRQIIRKLDQWARDGWPPGPIVAAAAERGWTTVFETDEMKAPRNGQSRPQPHGRPANRGSDPLLDALARATAEARDLERASADPAGGFGTGYALPAP